MTKDIVHTRPSRRSILAGATAALFSGFTFGMPANDAQAATAAENFIKDVGTRILGVVNGGGNNTSKKDKFFNLLWSKAARAKIAVFSLGSYGSQYRSLSGSSKNEYVRLVMRFVAGVFIRHINDFAGNEIKILGSTVRSSRDIIVRSQVLYSSGRKLDVQWRVTTSGGALKVFDVRVSGVWLATTQKSEFVSIIRRNDGKIQGLIEYLRSNA